MNGSYITVDTKQANETVFIFDKIRIGNEIFTFADTMIIGEKILCFVELIPGNLISIYIMFVLGGGVFTIATSLLGGIAMLRYPLMKIAEDGWLPPVFKKTTKSGYPWVIQLIFYLLSVLPILLGFSLDSIISLVMIPSMLMNVYLNLACIALPKQYPDQWEKCTLRMPIPLYNVICVLSAVCAGIVAYNLFKDLKGMDIIASVVILAVCWGFSLLRIKSGAVNKESLETNKQMIINQALADDQD
nr:amino acid permease [Clostridium sp. Marseille-P2415]